jgi:hypothetical protein
MNHAISNKKTSALGGDGAKVIVTAKNGIFFKTVQIVTHYNGKPV